MSTSYDVKLLQKKEVAEGTLEFTIEKPKGFEYRAGQYGDLVLPPSTGLDDSNNKHGFSFVSAPYEDTLRSEEHTSELQSLMRISYAVFCLKKKTKQQQKK